MLSLAWLEALLAAALLTATLQAAAQHHGIAAAWPPISADIHRLLGACSTAEDMLQKQAAQLLLYAGPGRFASMHDQQHPPGFPVLLAVHAPENRAVHLNADVVLSAPREVGTRALMQVLKVRLHCAGCLHAP